MHYCALHTGLDYAMIVGVEDGISCSSMGAGVVDVQLSAVMLPPLSTSEGVTLAGVIISCWLSAWVLALFIGLISEKSSTESE